MKSTSTWESIREKLILIVMIILLLLAVVAVFFLADVVDRRDETIDFLLNKPHQENNITSQRYESIDGQLRQITESSVNWTTKDDLRKSNDTLTQEVRKSLRGPIRSLEQVTRTLATAVTQLTSVPVRDTIIDGTAAQTFTYTDDWTSLRGVVKDGLLDMEINTRLDLQHEVHWNKADGLFKPKSANITLTSMNPHVTVDKVQTFRIVEKVPWWDKPGLKLLREIGIFAGGAYVGTKLR